MSNEEQHYDSCESKSASRKTSRLLDGIECYVGFEEHDISDLTIGTDSVSSCTFILIVGNWKEKALAYLSHYPECLEPSRHTSTSALIFFVNQISSQIEEILRKKWSISDQTFPMREMTISHLLIGGGVEEKRDLVREAFALLNKSKFNIDHLLETPSSKYLYHQLRSKAMILNPVTFLLSEKKKKRKGKSCVSTFDDCALVVKYHCSTKTSTLYIEWVGRGVVCTIASLSFVFGASDLTTVVWKKEEDEIALTHNQLKSNEGELESFNNALKYVVKSVFKDRRGYPFDFNLHVVENVKQFVVNQQNLLIETDPLNKEFYFDFLASIDRRQSIHSIDDHIRIHLCINTLLRQGKNNPVLVGKQGVQKANVVIGMVQSIEWQNIPRLVSKRLFTLNVEALLDAANSRNDFEESFRLVLNEIKKQTNGSALLFIDNIHRIIDDEHAEYGSNSPNLLRSILDEFQCIGTTTRNDYEKYIGKDAALDEHFQRILIKETSIDGCVSTLRDIKGRYESCFNVQILDPALLFAAEFSHRYIINSILPATAIEILQQACVHARELVDQQAKISDQFNVKSTSVWKNEKRKYQNDSQFKKIKRKKELSRDPIQSEQEPEHRGSESAQDEQEKCSTLAGSMGQAGASNLKVTTDQKESFTVKKHKQSESQLSPAVVGPNTIMEIVGRWNDIPVAVVNEIIEDRLSRLSENLQKKIIGQDETVGAVAEAIRTNRNDDSPRNKPIGSFLLLGPSGFGKTELAAALALELFYSSEALVRINLSEYRESHLADKLIGTSSSDEGLQRLQQHCRLEEILLRNPCVVILFDEVEKAHPRIWSALAQIMNHGYLINRQNQTVFFTFTIIILTSDIGAQHLSSTMENPLAEADCLDGKLSKTTKDFIMKEIESLFPPELVNCVNSLYFNSLNVDQISSIIRLQLQSAEESFKEEDIQITFTDNAIQSILKQSYNPGSGVRPVKNHVHQYITIELLKLLIQMNIQSHCRLTIDVAENGTYAFCAQLLEITNDQNSATSNDR